jgi:glucosamine--fructose-6-phosphate aminotransferase (isomerizing)
MCAALEAALKLREAAGVRAEGWSAADFRHGPLTVSGPALPTLAVSAKGPAATDVRELAEQLAAAGAPATVRAQQLALALARRRGVDPDHPPGLAKVTPTA